MDAFLVCYAVVRHSEDCDGWRLDLEHTLSEHAKAWEGRNDKKMTFLEIWHSYSPTYHPGISNT